MMPGVKKLLQQLNPHTANGPDQIPSHLLKDCAGELTPVISLLFQASINQHSIPAEWKKAHIVVLYLPLRKVTVVRQKIIDQFHSPQSCVSHWNILFIPI